MNLGIAVHRAAFAGGIERYAFDLASDLRSRGHRVELLADEDGREASFVAGFDAVRPLDARGLDVIYAQKISLLDALDRGAKALVAVHDHDDTCVRSHRYLPLGKAPCDRAPGVSCVAHGCVLVRDRSGPLPVKLVNPFALRGRLRRASERAPLVACSAYVAERVRDAGVRRVEVVHPIPRSFAAERTERPAAPRLLVVGQLVRGKGVDLAIAAMEHLPHATLEIAGDGPQRAELEAQARPFGARIRFVGRVSPGAVTARYDEASVVLVPSRWPEPFGMVGLEAMSRGRPVVAAAHGGIPEWLGDGCLGFTPGDPRSLANGARALLADDGAGERARSHAARTFSRDRMVDALERLLVEAA